MSSNPYLAQSPLEEVENTNLDTIITKVESDFIDYINRGKDTYSDKYAFSSGDMNHEYHEYHECFSELLETLYALKKDSESISLSCSQEEKNAIEKITEKIFNIVQTQRYNKHRTINRLSRQVAIILRIKKHRGTLEQKNSFITIQKNTSESHSHPKMKI